MKDTIPDPIQTLQQTLDAQVRDRAWRKILHTLAVTGVADNQQLLQATGLQRDKMRRTLEKMEAAAGGQPLFEPYSEKSTRAGQRGASTRVYRLAERGAELCQTDGLADARPCRLEDARAVRHALGMLDVHLAAQAAGLEVHTDRRLPYGEEGHIRPDNLVRLPGGELAIFESEQDARSDFLERIRRSLANKTAFFESDPAPEVSPTVRMLIDLPSGKLWGHTLSIWQHAAAIQRESRGDALPFRLLAMSLGEFLKQPDWSSSPQPPRWVDLTVPRPARATLALVQPGGQIQTSQGMPAFSTREQCMIVAALLEYLQESGRQNGAGLPQADVEFLYLLRLIYLASHDPFAPALARSSTPYASLFLLDQYLRMNPPLRSLLQEKMHMDARRIHWNQSTALHRMQVVVDAFLEYHGWQSDGPLLAYAYTPDYQARGPRRLSVAVQISDPEILMNGETAVVPGKQEIQVLEKALAWCLSAVFAHYTHLGFRKAPFW